MSENTDSQFVAYLVLESVALASATYFWEIQKRNTKEIQDGKSEIESKTKIRPAIYNTRQSEKKQFLPRQIGTSKRQILTNYLLSTVIRNYRVTFVFIGYQ